MLEITDLRSLLPLVPTIEQGSGRIVTAISFDIDGTLLSVNTICMVLAESAVEVLAAKGCLLRSNDETIGAYERAQKTVGKVRFGRWQDQIKIFQPTLSDGESMSRADGESLVSCYNAAFQRALLINRFKESLYSDTIDVLTELHHAGVKILIHSGRYTDLSKPQLASVGIQLEDEGGILYKICGGDEGNKIQQIRNHLENLGLRDPSRLVVVGDTEDDLDAAIENGAHAVKIDRQ